VAEALRAPAIIDLRLIAGRVELHVRGPPETQSDLVHGYAISTRIVELPVVVQEF